MGCRRGWAAITGVARSQCMPHRRSIFSWLATRLNVHRCHMPNSLLVDNLLRTHNPARELSTEFGDQFDRLAIDRCGVKRSCAKNHLKGLTCVQRASLGIHISHAEGAARRCRGVDLRAVQEEIVQQKGLSGFGTEVNHSLRRRVTGPGLNASCAVATAIILSYISPVIPMR